jgi:hypothetical protein
MPIKNTATIVSIITPFCIRPFSGDRELKSPNCFSKSSQSRLFILKSPLGRRGLDFGKRAPGAVRSLNRICSKAGRIKIISGVRRTVIATFLAMHKFQGPRTATFLPICAGRPRSAKTKKCDPSHTLFAGPATNVGGGSSTGGPHATAPNSCINPSGCFLSWHDRWIYARPA